MPPRTKNPKKVTAKKKAAAEKQAALMAAHIQIPTAEDKPLPDALTPIPVAQTASIQATIAQTVLVCTVLI
jgi:hypothetical protein